MESGETVEGFGLSVGVKGSEFVEDERHFAAIVHGLVVYPVGGEEEKAGDAMFEKERAGDGVALGEAIVKGEKGGGIRQLGDRVIG